jgi:3-dehydroquinate dehydratase-2
MKVLILNGVNLNLLGKREPLIYGSESFEQYFEILKREFNTLELNYFQSNVEGEIVNTLQQADTTYKAIILNAGAYTHTSIAIADAIAAIEIPVVEVHITNIFKREDFRHVSYLGAHCAGTIGGFGLESYALALQWVLRNL